MKNSFTREASDQLYEINQLKDEISYLNQRIYLIEVSISWRITKPLRWLSKRFPILSTLFRAIFRPAISIKRKFFSQTTTFNKDIKIAKDGEEVIRFDGQIKVKSINDIDDSNLLASFDRRPVIVLAHFLPTRPRAGNEYRLQQVLNWFKKNKLPYILIHSPLIGESTTSQLLQEAVIEHPNFISINRNGELNFSSCIRELQVLLNSFNGLKVQLPKELAHEHTSYLNPDLFRAVNQISNDALTWLVINLAESLKPSTIYANYIFMSRTFDLIDSKILKIIDTHDMFSAKDSRVKKFGVNTYAMSTAEEEFLAKRADVIIAIQKEEEALFKEMLPQKDVITLGVEVILDQIEFSNKANQNVVLLVASNNPMNAKGLFDFLAFAWPIVRREVPGAEFWVVGGVGELLIKVPEGVKVLGKVEDLRGIYANSKVVINPAIAGTGLKIKTLEALGYGRPVICWSAGIDGMPIGLSKYCKCANSWFEFTQELINLLKKQHDELNDLFDYSEISMSLDPTAIYAEFQHLLTLKKILNVD